jgi:hypothetical protein
LQASKVLIQIKMLHSSEEFSDSEDDEQLVLGSKEWTVKRQAARDDAQDKPWRMLLMCIAYVGLGFGLGILYNQDWSASTLGYTFGKSEAPKSITEKDTRC